MIFLLFQKKSNNFYRISVRIFEAITDSNDPESALLYKLNNS